MSFYQQTQIRIIIAMRHIVIPVVLGQNTPVTFETFLVCDFITTISAINNSVTKLRMQNQTTISTLKSDFTVLLLSAVRSANIGL